MRCFECSAPRKSWLHRPTPGLRLLRSPKPQTLFVPKPGLRLLFSPVPILLSLLLSQSNPPRIANPGLRLPFGPVLLFLLLPRSAARIANPGLRLLFSAVLLLMILPQSATPRTRKPEITPLFNSVPTPRLLLQQSATPRMRIENQHCGSVRRRLRRPRGKRHGVWKQTRLKLRSSHRRTCGLPARSAELRLSHRL